MSRARRGSSDLCGVLLIDKPTGPTSHDVINRVRRAAGERRVGHAGTLDPLASGLLVVLVGPATRLEPYLASQDKAYDALVRFGTSTDSDDSQGEVVETAPVPEELLVAARAQRVLDGFLGSYLQVPPQYSAIKVEGKVAHRVARRGGELELAPRPVTVGEAGLLGVDTAAMAWNVRFSVSKGTYVRALARDIGRAVDCPAHLAGLRRTRIGKLQVDGASTLEAVERAGSEGRLAELFIDPVQALDMPVVTADPVDVASGRPLRGRGAEAGAQGGLAAVATDDELTALYRRSKEDLVAEVVFARPVVRVS